MLSPEDQLNRLFLKAVARGDVEAAHRYLELEANINARLTTEKGRPSALHLAVENNDVHMAGFLISRGMDVNIRNAEADTPLHRAATRNFPKMIHFLHAHGADADVTSHRDIKPIWDALWGGQFEAFRALLDVGAYEPEWQKNGEDSTTLRKVRQRSMVNHETLLKEYHKVAERVDSGEVGLKEWLFKPDGNGRMPMESAAAWQRLEVILQQCEAEDTPLTKDDFALGLGGSKSLWQSAVACHSFKDMADYFARAGAPLAREDFITEDRKPTALLEALVDTCQLPLIFGVSRKEGRDPEFLRALYRAIPDEDRDIHLPNYHSLLAQERQGQHLRER